MGYMHIDNLYKNQEILMFKECYAMEKIHGTSAHVSYKIQDGKPMVSFFSGGENHQNFVALFDQDELKEKFKEIGAVSVTVYGEAYGGKQQKMSDTYGKALKFIAFDVKIDDNWLAVPQAEDVARQLGIEFVDYVKVSTDLKDLDEQRDRPSEQAIRNGCGNDKKREGVVLRPLVEMTKNNGKRILCKHKGDDFKETKTPREVSPEQLKVLSDAKEIAEEWVTPMRITHVLDKIQDPGMEKMKEIISAMIEDVQREGEGEIEWSKPVSKAIARATAVGVKAHFEALMRG
jgi:hypothetical protein